MNREEQTYDKREMNPGKEWAIRLKPAGCIAVLIFSLLCVAMMFTAGPDKIEGFEPAQTDTYYAQHLEDLQTELETYVFPEVSGVVSCEERDGALVITLESEDFINTRAAILQYYDQSLFIFEKN